VINNPLAHVRDEISKLPNLSSHESNWWEAIETFRARIGRASRMVISEPEIIGFAALQWLLIAAGYVAWFQILHFVPNEVPTTAGNPSVGVGISSVIVMLLVASLWSLAVLAVVALPVGLLSAAMGAAHILRRTGQPSTTWRCLNIASQQVRALWTYHAIDGYVTVNAVLARLPKRHGNRSPIERVAQETLYFAWKLGCAGVLPAMICGHGLIDSGRRSLSFVKAKLGELAALRAGYGGLCWLIGAAAYVLSFVIMFEFPHWIPKSMMVGGSINTVVLFTGIPMMSALAIILVVLQPIYIVTVCDLYADYAEESGAVIELPEADPSERPVAMSLFAHVAVAILVALCASQLGFVDWVTGFDRGAA